MPDPYAIRCAAERIVGEDRVPTEVLEQLIADYGDQGQVRTYADHLALVRDFTEGLSGDNPEYERGQLELLADLFPKIGVACGDRAQEIAADIRKMAAV